MFLALGGFLLMVFLMSLFKIHEYIILISVIAYLFLIFLKHRSESELRRIALQTGKELTKGKEIKTKRVRDLEKLKEKSMMITILVAFFIMLVLIGKYATKEHALMFLITFCIIAPITKSSIEYLLDSKGLIALDFEHRKVVAWKLSFRAFNMLRLEDAGGNSSYLHEPFKGSKGTWYIVDVIDIKKAKVLVNELHNNSELVRGVTTAFISLKKDWAKVREENAIMSAMQDRLSFITALKMLQKLSPVRKAISGLLTEKDGTTTREITIEDLELLKKYYPEKVTPEMEQTIKDRKEG